MIAGYIAGTMLFGDIHRALNMAVAAGSASRHLQIKLLFQMRFIPYLKFNHGYYCTINIKFKERRK